ncbi:unnamed protein product [Lupinus luteus]|uniref:Uncharacterized protein n=1 Tax=Lupinus luteus TaxID=3873 RepID=A0AAV1W2V7_LUPLU
MAFHANGEIIDVASGHKLYMWHYNNGDKASTPVSVLKTRRSLRAVHFHPHVARYILTAQVNDLDCSDTSMTVATCLGYSQCPLPVVFVTNVHPRTPDDLTSEYNFQADTNATEHEAALSSSDITTGFQSVAEYNAHATLPNQMRIDISNLTMETVEIKPAEGSNHGLSRHTTNREDLSEFGQFHHIFPSRDRSGWELPFLQGWLMGQIQVGVPSTLPQPDGSHENLPQQIGSSTMPSNLSTANVELASSSEMPSSISIPGSSAGSGMLNHLSQTFISRIQSELATSMTAAELPCTVKLKIWSHDLKNPCAPLNRCRLTIPHVVLCSEMGAHFSPCGRFLATCVTCMLPRVEADQGLQTLVHQEPGLATSATRHPIPAHQVIYELRIYSLEEETFGTVLASRAIRAAQCLTSIQFSPTSEHIRLAYGRRHGSLLKSIIVDEETTLPIYTVLECSVWLDYLYNSDGD